MQAVFFALAVVRLVLSHTVGMWTLICECWHVNDVDVEMWMLSDVKSPLILCFRVKFYPSDPTQLKEEITRYWLSLIVTVVICCWCWWAVLSSFSDFSLQAGWHCILCQRVMFVVKMNISSRITCLSYLQFIYNCTLQYETLHMQFVMYCASDSEKFNCISKGKGCHTPNGA